MVEEKKEVVKKEAAPPAVINNDNLGFGAGGDNDELISVPRAALVNTGSPALKDPNAVCKYGDYINSITKQPLKENVFIPIAFSNNWIRFNAKKDDEPGYNPDFGLGDIIWRAGSKNDPTYNDAEAHFGPNGEKPLATHFLNFLSYFPETNSLMMVSFSKGSFYTGRELFNMIHSQKPKMPYTYQYKLGHISKTGPSGDDYLMATVSMSGKTEPDLYAKMNGIAQEFATKLGKVQVDDDSLNQD